MSDKIKIKRIYEKANSEDGFRILVDRLWPRGVSKEKAKLDLWLKEIGPSDDLRKWFNHQPERFNQFEIRYKKELGCNPATQAIKQIIRDNSKVTLLYGAHDEKFNQAVVLKDYLK